MKCLADISTWLIGRCSGTVWVAINKGHSFTFPRVFLFVTVVMQMGHVVAAAVMVAALAPQALADVIVLTANQTVTMIPDSPASFGPPLPIEGFKVRAEPFIRCYCHYCRCWGLNCPRVHWDILSTALPCHHSTPLNPVFILFLYEFSPPGLGIGSDSTWCLCTARLSTQLFNHHLLWAVDCSCETV